MYLGNLSDTDRTIAGVVQWLAIGLLGGLTATGVWQFLFHEANSSWSRYELGSDRFLLPASSTGMADVHGALADLAGLLALFLVAWLSARVLHRVSWFALGTLALLIVSLYTGTLIRFNATFESGTVSINDPGYAQFFLGSADGAITDRFQLGTLAIVFWTLAHIISIPVLLGAAWMTIRRAEARRIARKGQHRSWLSGRSAAQR